MKLYKIIFEDDYKMFDAKTEIVFDDNNIIVGANGCGKQHY